MDLAKVSRLSPSSVEPASLTCSNQEALKVLLQGRTSFIVAHRLSKIRHADKIIVLDHGEIKEQGTHEELVRHGGIYNGLVEAQFRFL